MCPAETPPDDAPPPPPPTEPLENFMVEAARAQAVERGEEADDVDEAFINRALAESRRMRSEANSSNAKRAANFASIASRHGTEGVSAIQQAMLEHAAEVLLPEQQTAVANNIEEPEAAEPPVYAETQERAEQ